MQQNYAFCGGKLFQHVELMPMCFFKISALSNVIMTIATTEGCLDHFLQNWMCADKTECGGWDFCRQNWMSLSDLVQSSSAVK